MNAEISETIRARLLGFGMPIPELCHAHSNAHKPPKPVAPIIFMLDKKFELK